MGNISKNINWLLSGFIVLGGIGMIFTPNLMVEMLCPRKTLFGIYMIFTGVISIFSSEVN